MGLTLLRHLHDHAAIRGGDVALRVIGPMANRYLPVTWASLLEQTRSASTAFDRLLPPDAVVLMMSPNRPSVVPNFLGLLASGRTVFPIDAALTAVEVERLASRSSANAIVLPDYLVERVASLALLRIDIDQTIATHPIPAGDDRLGRDGVMYLQSSGTTGGTKIVHRTGASLDAVAENVAAAVGLRSADRVVAAVPLTHSYGIENGMLAPLIAGSTMLHHVVDPTQPGRGFDPMLAVHSDATVLPGVPAMFEMIERMQAGRGRLRLAYSAGAPLPPALSDSLEQRDGLRVGQLYGSTEIGSVTFGLDPDCVGQPMSGVEVLILDPSTPDPTRPLPTGAEGHIAVRAPSMFDHYLDSDTQAEMADGFFLTGDLGRFDEDGRLTVTGRLKLLIDVGGVKVNPIEVEQVIREHPAVLECVVVPDPVSPTINRVRAVLKVVDESVFDPADLRAFLRQRLAAHKIPRQFEVRRSLPKSPTGKVLRQALRGTL